jgi:hypothetical protein
VKSRDVASFGITEGLVDAAIAVVVLCVARLFECRLAFAWSIDAATLHARALHAGDWAWENARELDTFSACVASAEAALGHTLTGQFHRAGLTEKAPWAWRHHIARLAAATCAALGLKAARARPTHGAVDVIGAGQTQDGHVRFACAGARKVLTCRALKDATDRSFVAVHTADALSGWEGARAVDATAAAVLDAAVCAVFIDDAFIGFAVAVVIAKIADLLAADVRLVATAEKRRSEKGRAQEGPQFLLVSLAGEIRS